MGNQNDSLNDVKPDNNQQNIIYANQNNINKAQSNPPQIHRQLTGTSQNPQYQNQNSYNNFNIQNNPYNLNPNNNSSQNFNVRTNTTNQKKYKYNLNSKMLKNAFYNFAIDHSYLNKSKFNDATESLFNFPIPEMHYTYLLEKIYYIIDDSGDEKIQEDEFMQLKNVLSSRDYRLKLSMMAMMTTKDKNRDYIDVNEIKDFFYKSFVQGYKHLIYQCKKSQNEFIAKNIPIVNQKQIELWAEKYESQIKSYIDNDLRQNNIDPYKIMDFETFKNWINKDHSLYLQYGHKNCVIATSLIKLDEIGFAQ
jgi:hypothetical protein